MSLGSYGIDLASAEDLFGRLKGFIEKRSASMVVRPGRVCKELPKVLVSYEEKPYAVGDVDKCLKKEAMEVTVRTGIQVDGPRLPKPPEGPSRFRVAGSLQKALDELKAMESRHIVDNIKSAEEQGFRKTLSSGERLMDYASKGLMGTGLGRTIGFLKGMSGMGPEAYHRYELANMRLGRLGGVLGLAIAGVTHASAKRKDRERRERAMTSALNTVMRQVSRKDMMKGLQNASEAYRPSSWT